MPDIRDSNTRKSDGKLTMRFRRAAERTSYLTDSCIRGFRRQMSLSRVEAETCGDFVYAQALNTCHAVMNAMIFQCIPSLSGMNCCADWHFRRGSMRASLVITLMSLPLHPSLNCEEITRHIIRRFRMSQPMSVEGSHHLHYTTDYGLWIENLKNRLDVPSVTLRSWAYARYWRNDKR